MDAIIVKHSIWELCQTIQRAPNMLFKLLKKALNKNLGLHFRLSHLQKNNPIPNLTKEILPLTPLYSKIFKLIQLQT